MTAQAYFFTVNEAAGTVEMLQRSKPVHGTETRSFYPDVTYCESSQSSRMTSCTCPHPFTHAPTSLLWQPPSLLLLHPSGPSPVGLKYYHDPFQADPARQYTASFILTYGGGQVRYTTPHHAA
jgi:hypothetical protein